MKRANRQNGAVSLFVVIFAALLITVVTVSFIRIMIQNQQQATAHDLSQSAYDSAQAGVEDGKRAILLLQSYCNSIDPADQIKCTAGQQQTCNAAVGLLTDVQANTTTDGTNEVKVQTSGSENLNQAYTCVKITTNTTNVEGYLAPDASKVIPIVGVGSIDRIKIDWFTSKDSATAFAPTNSNTPLPMKSNWVSNLAPIMRAQLIEIGHTFTINDINNNVDTANGSNNTLFLYPSNMPAYENNFSLNLHPTPGASGTKGSPNAPSRVDCNSISVTDEYSCSAEISLPKAVSSGGYSAYLNLKSIYKATHYKVTLLDSTGATILFNNVQPSIDSTGRANDQFRRVRTRVEYSNINFPYPQGEINVTGNLCKNFAVTDAIDGYSNSCNP